jgi:hypothetical protein
VSAEGGQEVGEEGSVGRHVEGFDVIRLDERINGNGGERGGRGGSGREKDISNGEKNEIHSCQNPAIYYQRADAM